MSYRIAATPATMSDLQGHSPIYCQPFQMWVFVQLCSIL